MQEASDSHPPQRAKILIVEDEGLIARDLASRVRKAGYEVAGVFDSGEAALAKVEEAGPDLILMDIRLRGPMDGIETAREIQLRYDLPVIYLTAHTDRETVDRAKTTGAFGYLSKPIGQASLPTSIEVALYKHRADRDVRKQRAWLRTTLAAMSDAVIVTDDQGSVQYLNPAAEGLTGWPSGEAVNQQLAKVLPLFDPLAGKWLYQEAPLAGGSSEGPASLAPGLRLINRTGGQITVEVEVAPSIEGGRRLGSVITFRDVTNRAQEEQERRHEQKMQAVGRLAAGVAHDFNNALTVVLGQASLALTRGQNLDEATRNALSEIEGAGTAAAAVTRQLLTFSRSGAGQPELVNLNDIVRQNEDFCRSSLGGSVVWRTSLDPGLKLLHATPAQLSQLLVNLVVNARDAMPQGGTLTVSTENVDTGTADALSRESGNHVVLKVTDTGIGMDLAVAERIFEPFFTTKQIGHGKGLGLAIVHNIVSDLGGIISVESKPASGSTFHVFLPAARESTPALPGIETGTHVAATGRRTVLLVDDNDAVRSLANAYVKGAGYEVLQAADGEQALALAATHEGAIDVLVTDVVMPVMNGVQLSQKLGERWPNLKTVYFSGYDRGIVGDQAELPASARFLQKPFLCADLVNLIQQLLDEERHES